MGEKANRNTRDRSVVRLEWAVVAGRMLHVRQLVQIDEETRRQARCPACDGAAVVRLGPIRAHHVAHKAKTGCGATSEETALHLNAKHHLAAVLRGTVAIHARQTCSAPPFERAPACHGFREFELAAGWDEVEVESHVSRWVPDVVLRKQKMPIAALEVWVTHRNSEAKIRGLAEGQLPWVEFRPNQEFYSGKDAWNGATPLPIDSAHDAVQWVCEPCLAARARRERLAREAEERKQAEEERRIEEQSERREKSARFRELLDTHYSQPDPLDWQPWRLRIFRGYGPDRDSRAIALVLEKRPPGGGPVDLRVRSIHDGVEVWSGQSSTKVENANRVDAGIATWQAAAAQRGSIVRAVSAWIHLDPLVKDWASLLEECQACFFARLPGAENSRVSVQSRLLELVVRAAKTQCMSPLSWSPREDEWVPAHGHRFLELRFIFSGTGVYSCWFLDPDARSLPESPSGHLAEEFRPTGSGARPPVSPDSAWRPASWRGPSTE